MVAPLVGVNAIPLRPDGRPAASGPVAVQPMAGSGTSWRSKLLAGRLPRRIAQVRSPSARLARAACICTSAARWFSGPALARCATGRTKLRLRERVVGIFVGRGSVGAVTDIDKLSEIFASTALV